MEGFSKIQKNFGFGCMRLPMKDGAVDYAVFTEMVDAFLDAGFNYFDTAHIYLEGKSEIALRECLTSRYPRDRYVLVDKLSTANFTAQEEIRPLFERQLEACGVDYFDIYLMHAQSKRLFEKYKKCHAYETALALRDEGKIKHFGISFHDKAEVLEEILTEYPQIEVVQIQFNYVDYEDASIQSRKVYEVCRKFGKPVVVMEPVKGGSLVHLPQEAQAVFEALQGGSNASYAIRFAASFQGVMMVLSGMGDMDMMKDNIGYMKDFKPLDREERAAVDQVCAIFRKQNRIPCTDCKYCVAGCPKEIPIPNLFACMNNKNIFHNWSANYYYGLHTAEKGKASDCIQCGNCETLCPQHLPIRQLLCRVAKEFET